MQRAIQKEKVLRHCKKYGSISALEAVNEYMILRLSNRITELEQEGHVFRRKTQYYKNSEGATVHYMRYYYEGGPIA